MKSFVLSALLLSIVATSAQDNAVKAIGDEELFWSCDVIGIIALAKDMVADSITLLFDLKSDLIGIPSGTVSCVLKNLIKPVTMVNCVVNTIKTEGGAGYNTVKLYLSDMWHSVRKFKTKIQQCL